jgi:hypothetical protein
MRLASGDERVVVMTEAEPGGIVGEICARM